MTGGCGSNASGSGNVGCPAEEPTTGEPCDSTKLPHGGPCYYGPTCGQVTAYCQQGEWNIALSSCNPPPQVSDAAPDVSDAASDVSESGLDGEGKDAAHD